MTTIDDLDPCRPWYLSVSAQGARAKAWQSTDPEPDGWLIDIPAGDRPWGIDIMAVGFQGRDTSQRRKRCLVTDPTAVGPAD